MIATDVRAIAINPVGTIFAETAGCGTGVYRSTDNGDSWSLANIGLTSTDVAALAVNGSNYHVFAGTHSIMGKGGGMFDPLITVIHGRNKMEASQHLTCTA